MRSERLRTMAWALIGLAAFFSLIGYLFFPARQQETFYMLSVVFVGMAGICWFE